MSNLKNCPFCGSRNVAIHLSADARWHWVECGGCGARGPEVRVLMDVAGEWNRRADFEPMVIAPPDKLTERMKACAINPDSVPKIGFERSGLKAGGVDAGPTPFAGRNKGVSRDES